MVRLVNGAVVERAATKSLQFASGGAKCQCMVANELTAVLSSLSPPEGEHAAAAVSHGAGAGQGQC